MTWRPTHRALRRELDDLRADTESESTVTISPETERRIRAAWEAVDNPGECPEDLAEYFVYPEKIDDDMARAIRHWDMQLLAERENAEDETEDDHNHADTE
jgi:hypothetical protein